MRPPQTDSPQREILESPVSQEGDETLAVTGSKRGYGVEMQGQEGSCEGSISLSLVYCIGC